VSDEDKEEVTESQKLSPRDKKEIQEGACVNCALLSFIFMVITIMVMAL
jgi:hypothetical protein